MTDSFTLCKLIILFMLDKVNFAMTTSQISEMIVEKDYNTFFTVQQAIHELTDSKLILADSTQGTTYYKNTSSGHDTLLYFQNRIPSAIAAEILAYLDEKKYELKNKASIQSNYYPGSKGDYLVRLQVKEGDLMLIDLTLSVPDESMASSMCNKWEQRSSGLYSMIMEKLL